MNNCPGGLRGMIIFETVVVSDSFNATDWLTYFWLCMGSEFTANLLDAVALGDANAVVYILSKTNHNFEKHIDAEGNNVLHYCASVESETLTSLLIQYNAVNCVNMINSAGETPLHWHCRNSCMLGASVLLSNKADPDITNLQGISPLQIAVLNKNDDLCNLLYSFGAKKLAQLR